MYKYDETTLKIKIANHFAEQAVSKSKKLSKEQQENLYIKTFNSLIKVLNTI